MINRRTLLQAILALPFGLKPAVKIIGYGWIPLKSKVNYKYITKYYPLQNLTVLIRELQ